nr:uncharacterized protein LOC109153696 isoform X3 [Ipomoea trifida]
MVRLSWCWIMVESIFFASSCSEEEDDDDHVFISSCGSNSPDMGMSTDDQFLASHEAMKNEKHIAARRLGKSLEKDFELVYVAQSCLSWEALHHQFTKVKAEAPHMLLFHNSVTERFQKFQIVLERFLEDESSLWMFELNEHLEYYNVEEGGSVEKSGRKKEMLVEEKSSAYAGGGEHRINMYKDRDEVDWEGAQASHYLHFSPSMVSPQA